MCVCLCEKNVCVKYVHVCVCVCGGSVCVCPETEGCVTVGEGRCLCVCMCVCAKSILKNICGWMLQLTFGRWDKNRAGRLGMNLRGPISQKQFLYVVYTHLEWRLIPPGPQHTTHSYWRSPMKYRTDFIGHVLFIYPL